MIHYDTNLGTWVLCKPRATSAASSKYDTSHLRKCIREDGCAVMSLFTPRDKSKLGNLTKWIMASSKKTTLNENVRFPSHPVLTRSNTSFTIIYVLTPQKDGPYCKRNFYATVSGSKILLVKIKMVRWLVYPRPHHVPVVKGVVSNPSMNPSTNGNLGHLYMVSGLEISVSKLTLQWMLNRNVNSPGIPSRTVEHGNEKS